MFIKQLSVFLQNEPGRLQNVTEILKDGGIDIRALNVSEGKEFGILRCLLDDTYKAKFLLEENGYLCKLSDVLAIEPEDKIGSVNEVLKALSDGGINLNYIYSTIRPLHEEKPLLVISTSDQDKALEVLQNLEIPLVSSKEKI